MFGKVNPAPAVSRCVRMVFRNLPEPLKPFKPLKATQKHDIDENLGFRLFAVFGPYRTCFWRLFGAIDVMLFSVM